MLNENELDLYPETEKIIKNLHDQDLKIGLVSNSPDKTVNEIIDFLILKDTLNTTEVSAIMRTLITGNLLPETSKLHLQKLVEHLMFM